MTSRRANAKALVKDSVNKEGGCVKEASKEYQPTGVGSRLTEILLAIGAVLTTVGFVLAFTIAAPVNGATVDGVELIGDTMVANQQLFSQKIFYFHMPVAVVSFVILGFAAYCALRYLMTKRAHFDMCSQVATRVALLFVVMTMITGVLWTRFEWGVWWTWEPRLTTYLILTLMVMGYFVLRTAIDEPERRATFASVFNIIMFIDVPICMLITRMIPSSVHPVVFRTDSGLSPDMLIPLLMNLFGMLCIGIALYQLSARNEHLAQRLEAIKEVLDRE